MNATLFKVGDIHESRVCAQWTDYSADVRKQCKSVENKPNIAAYFSRFIEENHSYKKQQQQEQQRRPSYHGAPPQDLMSYWGTHPLSTHYTSSLTDVPGYKFETLCLLPDTWDHTSRDFIENRENAVVDNHAQYCSVVKTQIGNAKLILGGEVDAGEFFL